MIQLVAALVIAVAGFFGGWVTHGWKFDSQEKAHVQNLLISAQANYANSLRKWDNIFIAQEAAARREANLRRDVAGARSALVGLSDAADSALRSAADSQSACLATAATLRDLLKSSEDANLDLSEKADRHVSDIRTLIQSWPTEQSHGKNPNPGTQEQRDQ